MGMPCSLNMPSCSVRRFQSGSSACRSKVCHVISKPAAGYEITWQTRDLHNGEPDWNIRTEHEGMFTEMGIPIKALIARKLPGDESVTWVEPKKLARQQAAAGEAADACPAEEA